MARLGVEHCHRGSKRDLPEARMGVKDFQLWSHKRPPDVPAALCSTSGAILQVLLLVMAKLKIVLARIDTRLLHGQVATTWTKMTKPDRIIVCLDGAAQDELLQDHDCSGSSSRSTCPRCSY